uniref:Rho guanine nucleotide exchange factor 17 isoform X3 n=1 Tax=Hirondellea gigas TaxID=1518452 RepID=A0A6A7FTN7_9CRUS
MDSKHQPSSSVDSTAYPSISRSISLFSWPNSFSSITGFSTSTSPHQLQPRSAPASIVPLVPLWKSPSVSSLSDRLSYQGLPSLSASISVLTTPSRTRKSIGKRYTDSRALLAAKLPRRIREKYQLDDLPLGFKGLQTRSKCIGYLEDESGSFRSAWESAPNSKHMVACPSITPLAAPSSPRPLRCFNSSPRPWIARKYNSVSPEGHYAGDECNFDNSRSFSFDESDQFSRKDFLAVNTNQVKIGVNSDNITADIIRGLKEVIARRRSRVGSAPDIRGYEYSEKQNSVPISKTDVFLVHQRRLLSMEGSLDYIDDDSLKEDNVPDNRRKSLSSMKKEDACNKQENSNICNENNTQSDHKSIADDCFTESKCSKSDETKVDVTEDKSESTNAISCIYNVNRTSETHLPHDGIRNIIVSESEPITSFNTNVNTNASSVKLGRSYHELSVCNNTSALLPRKHHECADDTSVVPTTTTTTTSVCLSRCHRLPNTTITTDQNKQTVAIVSTKSKKEKKDKETNCDKQWKIKSARRTIKETLERKFHSSDDLRIYNNNNQSVFKKSPLLSRSFGYRKDKIKSKIPLATTKNPTEIPSLSNNKVDVNEHTIAHKQYGEENEFGESKYSWSNEVIGKVYGGPSKYRRPGPTPSSPSAPNSGHSPTVSQPSTMFSYSAPHPCCSRANSASCTCVTKSSTSDLSRNLRTQPVLIKSNATVSIEVQGGSGDGDRPPPHTSQTEIFLQDGIGRAVRRKPNIPLNLAKRRRGHLSPLNTSTSDCSVTSVSPVAAGGTSPRVTVNHILASLNFARFRLGDITSSLSGTKKENNNAPPPIRPPRTRHDTDKTRKISGGAKQKATCTDDDAKSNDILGWRRRRSATEGGGSSLLTMPITKHSFLTRTRSAPQSQKQQQTEHELSKNECVSTYVEASPDNLGGYLHLTENSPLSGHAQNKEVSPVFGASSSHKSINPDTPQGAIVKSLLPPLPRDARLLHRDIPFRSASVSQTELNTDVLKGGRTSPSLRLYPACKEYGKHNTLPRRTVDTAHDINIRGDRLPCTSSCADISNISSSSINLDSVKYISEVEINEAAPENIDVANSPVVLESECCVYQPSDISYVGKNSENQCSENVPIGQMDVSSGNKKNKKVVFGLWPSVENISHSVSDLKFGVGKTGSLDNSEIMSNDSVNELASDCLENVNTKKNNGDNVPNREGCDADINAQEKEKNASTCASEISVCDTEAPVTDLSLSRDYAPNPNMLATQVVKADLRRGSLPCEAVFPQLMKQNIDTTQNETARESIIQAVNKLMNRSKMSPSPASEFVSAQNERNRQFRRGSSFDYCKNNAGDNAPCDRKVASFSISLPINENEATGAAEESQELNISKLSFFTHKCLKRSDGIDIINQEDIENQNSAKINEFEAVKSRIKEDERQQKKEGIHTSASQNDATNEKNTDHALISQLSDEGISIDEVRRRQPVLTSDSSSQDSTGMDNYRSDEGIAPGTSEAEIDITCGGEDDFNLLERVESMLRRTNLDNNQSDHSLTYPPGYRNKGDMGYSSIDSSGLKSLVSNAGPRGDASEGQSSSISLADSFPSEGEDSNTGVETATLRVALNGRLQDRDERKLKHYSDPSSERRLSSGIPTYLTISGDDQNHSQKCVISQPSTDSEGKEELGHELLEAHFGNYGAQYVSSPQVLLTGYDQESWPDRPQEGLFSRSSRTTSPSSCFQDSDSGDLSLARSPHGPRRYSKRPLRGPYGEMLEAEMSKTKSNYLSDDMYLPVRDSKSSSPCPHTPSASASPAFSPILSINSDIRIPCRSLDDSAIRLFYSEHCSPNSNLPTSPPSVTSCSSEGESGFDLLPLRPPIHQRTKSSPSKLFCEASITSEEEPEHSEYYKAAKRFIARQVREKTKENSLGMLIENPFSRQFDKTDDDCESKVSELNLGKQCKDNTQSEGNILLVDTETNEMNDILLLRNTSEQSLLQQEEVQQQTHTQQESHSQPRHQLQPSHLNEHENLQQHLHSQHLQCSPGQQQHSQQQQQQQQHQLQQPQNQQTQTSVSDKLDHRHSHNRRHRSDTRAHVIGELCETEKNYVKKLSFLMMRYEQNLRSAEYSSIIDQSLVDDIFYQVPDILGHHERFLDDLRRKIESRDVNMCVGDVIYNMVSDPAVLGSYTSFTNNWKTAHDAAKSAAAAKPAFSEFLAAMAREHPGKMDLKALLISPVQRFPHYEMLLKRLLKHTPHDHPDAPLLLQALKKTQEVTVKINDNEKCALQQDHQQDILRDLENVIEGLEGLVEADRTFLQCDLATMHSALGTRKERCLFLFSDLLVIAAIKRRAGTLRKGSSLPWALLSSLEASKLKLFKFIPLDDLDIARSRDEGVKKLLKEIEGLESDLQTVQRMGGLYRSLRTPRSCLEDALHEAEAAVRKGLADRQGADSLLNEVELTITTQEGVESIAFTFHNPEKRANWEEAFHGAKQKLAMSADRRPPPEFVNALPIRKTRAGLQFTCAASTLGLNAQSLKDVWVCNSDGYVGQVCVLSLHPEPAVACCNGVCNARILSIASVPAAPNGDSSDDDEDEENNSDDVRKRRSESLPPNMATEESDAFQPTMWLGTEDGFIHVYNCTDSIRIKKNKFTFQLGSSVHCIMHLDNRVFASLASGEVVVYRRDGDVSWLKGDREVVTVSTAATPVTRMIMVAGKLWCAAGNVIKIMNTSTLQLEHSFMVVSGESGNRGGVSNMVSAGQGVWVAVQSSSVVRLYHATTHECLCEASVAAPVSKMLAASPGCDDIIRQHKAACLRVTALLACKDLLWVGTSAGVVLTAPLPHLPHLPHHHHSHHPHWRPSSSHHNAHHGAATLNLQAVPHGHTGQVRFLTSVELTSETRPPRAKSHGRCTASFKAKEHQPGTAAPSKLLVISGGDGYEDFRNANLSELAGRDDSTNHLLMWHV